MDEVELDIRDVLEAFSEPAAIVGQGRRIVAANCRFRDRFANGGDPCDHACHELLHGLEEPCETSGLECPLSRCLAQGGRPGTALHRHRTRLGGEPVELTVCDVTRGSSGVAYFLHLTRPLADHQLPAEIRELIG